MISLAVWPCSNPQHRDCYGVVNLAPAILHLLQNKEAPPLAYLLEHVSYDDAWALLRTDLFAEVIADLYHGQSLYDLSVCEDPTHHNCFNVIDIAAYTHDRPDALVLSHVSYIAALSKLHQLWQPP